MSKVILVMSMSLDGFITGANSRPEAPLGNDGEQLHDWLGDSRDPRNQEILEKGVNEIGAVITGRQNYEDSIKWWGADGPTGSVRLPVFVVTHRPVKDAPEGGVYTFVNGIEKALAGAKAAAGKKNVSVMGGADVGQQFLKVGLVDDIMIHLIPVLFGDGLRLFDHLDVKTIQLENVSAVQTQAATHLRFHVKK